MSTYLQLTQKVVLECINGYAGGPTTVVNQSGLLKKAALWVNDSWRDIQQMHNDWRWMRSQFTVNTVASTDTYAYTACTDRKTVVAITRFDRWWPDDVKDPFSRFLTSGGVGGQQWMIYIDYNLFRRLYKFGTQQSNTGQPVYVSVDDDDRIVLGPNPGDIYTIRGNYQRAPQTLAVDADTPDMPSRFHDLIVYYAMQRYAVNSIAPEVLARARLEGNRILASLEQSQLPEMSLGAPLA